MIHFVISHVTSNKKSRNLREKLKVVMHKNINETTSKLQNQLAEIEGLQKQKERGTTGNEKRTA